MRGWVRDSIPSQIEPCDFPAADPIAAFRSNTWHVGFGNCDPARKTHPVAHRKGRGQWLRQAAVPSNSGISECDGKREYRTVLAADKTARSSPERGSGRPPQCLSPFPRNPGGYRGSTSLVSISHLGNGLSQGNSTESLPGNSNPRSRATLPPTHDQVFVDSETRRSLGWVAHRHSRCQSACQSRCREAWLWGHWGEACCGAQGRHVLRSRRQKLSRGGLGIGITGRPVCE